MYRGVIRHSSRGLPTLAVIKMDPASLDSKIHERISASQQDMLGRLEVLLSSKLECFRNEVNDSQRKLSEEQISKISEMSSSAYTFKRKGNEEQFKVNCKVSTKLQEAHTNLVERMDTVAAAEKISEGMDIIKHRQKLIRLADSSESGWSTVSEYENNELADDSDDDRRIQRAENRAQRKLKAQRQARQRRYSPYGASRPQGTGERQADNSKPAAFSARRPGLCYACGKPGHWRSECLQQQRSVGNMPGAEKA
ncbi:uncharacterized protein LOC117322230 [Pecten maximus]|uniref:uncharacterized protein LOC117322230 n=1 Tax=Pecten maximus TaxID=6579 RepID=UPI001458DD92|nr:uncharacterized protein LOC117322230 [Pecten maximus]